jgi:hypothetical protein
MPSLISDAEKVNLGIVFEDVFDTFSRNIVIYKQPIKLSRNNISPTLFGFGEKQSDEIYTYQEVTGVYPATIRYNDLTKPNLAEGNIKYPKGTVTIKVEQDCRDFINTEKTEKILVDGNFYALNGPEQPRNFLDTKYWAFSLIPAQ